jgi:hypothetical protein
VSIQPNQIGVTCGEPLASAKANEAKAFFSGERRSINRSGITVMALVLHTKTG